MDTALILIVVSTWHAVTPRRHCDASVWIVTVDGIEDRRCREGVGASTGAVRQCFYGVGIAIQDVVDLIDVCPW